MVIMSSLDIQLNRDNKTGSLPYLSNWSRHEPASINRSALGYTDHWSKTKHKNVTLFTTTGSGKTYFFPGERAVHEIPPKAASLQNKPLYNVDCDMKHIGHESFTDMMLRQLGSYQPGQYSRCRPSPNRIPRSSYNERAKEGFEYWWKEKRQPSNKRWIGSGGNVLGTSCK